MISYKYRLDTHPNQLSSQNIKDLPQTIKHIIQAALVFVHFFNEYAPKYPVMILIWKLFLLIDWVVVYYSPTGSNNQRESAGSWRAFPPFWRRPGWKSICFLGKWSCAYSPWSRIYFTISPLPVLAAWWRSEQWSGPWISRLPPFL